WEFYRIIRGRVFWILWIKGWWRCTTRCCRVMDNTSIDVSLSQLIGSSCYYGFARCKHTGVTIPRVVEFTQTVQWVVNFHTGHRHVPGVGNSEFVVHDVTNSTLAVIRTRFGEI